MTTNAGRASAEPLSARVRSSDGTTIAYTIVGSGPGLIMVGGALATSGDYLPLAAALADSFTVHVVERRGRGKSGPQGAAYSIAKERDDLLAVQEATGATAVFGHSFGGLVALETASRSPVFSRIAVYEPGVPIGHAVHLAWIPDYRQLLAAGRRREAFACFARGSGFNPLARMPLWYARIVLRIAVRGDHWAQIEPLLESNLAEHEQLAHLETSDPDRYHSIGGTVLLLGGGKSPAFATTDLFAALAELIPDTTTKIIDGNNHTSPTGEQPHAIAAAVEDFLFTG